MSSTNDWQGRIAAITGAASGFGLEFARCAAERGMHVAMLDVQDDALARAADDIEAIAVRRGGRTWRRRVDVADPLAMDDAAAAIRRELGVPSMVFNNAGVAHGGLVWEHTLRDWEWLLGVNVWGVIHGVRLFVPMMLDEARRRPDFRGHVVNTASMAGLLAPPTMGAYAATKHAVVALTETLQHDLALVGDAVRAHLLCPYFVPTAIHHSARNRPGGAAAMQRATASQTIAQSMSERAVTGGKVSAAEVAQRTFDAIDAGRFYVFSHPAALGAGVARADDLAAGREPADPFAERPEIGEKLRAALRRPG